MSNSDFCESDKEFGLDICVGRKSNFMMLLFKEQVFKMRNYFMDKTYPFFQMSKKDKQNFRRLSKQFKLDDDECMLKKNKPTEMEDNQRYLN